MKNPCHLNFWYVEQLFNNIEWRLVPDSMGNKSYATGYAAALDSFYPHPPYRLIDNKGEVVKEIPAKSSPHIN